MAALERIAARWRDSAAPFLIHGGQALRVTQLLQHAAELDTIRPGEVVAVIGDFDAAAIGSLLRLMDLGAIVVPLTPATAALHEDYFDAALVDVVVEGRRLTRRAHARCHPLLDRLRAQGRGGLVLFSSGTTGRPKAILHDLQRFLARYATPRPPLKMAGFLRFDHIGGINTLLHALFNGGAIVVPAARSVDAVLAACDLHQVVALPATPTFLRMLLVSGALPERAPASLKLITYGTERMDQPTLAALCALLPRVEFRQTFGCSELGIVRVRSAARDSLWMQVGGEGVETRVVDAVLQMRCAAAMLGYLNAPSPFDAEGWYDTQDRVEQDGGWIRIVGRVGDLVNVGGEKFMLSEVEEAALRCAGVALVKAVARDNPLTGQHVELSVQPQAPGAVDVAALDAQLRARLAPHMRPLRIRLADIDVGPRGKKA